MGIHGKFKTFIGKIVILAPRVRIDITPEKVLFNGAELSWNDEHVFGMFGLQFHVGVTSTYDRVLKIDFEKNISIKIKRSSKEGTNRDVDYLNLYLDKEFGLSKQAGGILGEIPITTIFYLLLMKLFFSSYH